MNKKIESKAEETKPKIYGSQEKSPLKKDILEDLQSHNTFAILSSKGNKDLAIAFVTQGEYGLYQIKTVTATPLKKGVAPETAQQFYAEHITPIIKMLKSDNTKTLILDYNLSFWAHVNNVNLATYIIENTNVEKVWTYPKTRLAKPESLIKKGESVLTESGTIALSFLKSYYPESLKEVEIFNQDLDKSMEGALKAKKHSFSVSLDDVFDRENERKKQQTLEALEWALSQSKKIRNPSFAEVFEELIANTKDPVLTKKKK